MNCLAECPTHQNKVLISEGNIRDQAWKKIKKKEKKAALENASNYFSNICSIALRSVLSGAVTEYVPGLLMTNRDFVSLTLG